MRQKNREYMTLLRECLAMKPRDFVPGTPHHENCVVPPNAGRFGGATALVQRECIFRPGYMQAWTGEPGNAA